MWTSIVRFITGAVGAVRAKNFSPLQSPLQSPLRYVPWVLALLVCVFATLAWFQGLRLDTARAEVLRVQAEATRDISAEQAAHNATRAELAQARADIAALNEALAASENATAAVQTSLKAALSREAQALRDSAARKQILDAMRVRPRTATETQEVVDDDTRRAAADRLNRPL